jgi:pyruvate formate lyase activating enzyme
MNSQRREISGTIFDIQTYSIHDGPGIRTTVFMKGCPLRCPWCQNPESQSARPERLRDPDGSVRVIGRSATAGEVFDEVAKDAIFYRRSGGGVTLSGGEPLAQPRFAEVILGLCREAGFHTALDTTGHGKWSLLRGVFELCDLVLFDLKHLDPARHLALTGVSNDQILANLRRVRDLGIELWVRVPVVPGSNDDAENLAAVAEFVRRELGEAVRVFLLPYHQFGEGKHDALGRTHARIEPPSDERMSAIRDQMEAAGLTVQVGG